MARYLALINTKIAEETNIPLGVVPLNPWQVLHTPHLGFLYTHPNNRQEEDALFAEPEFKRMYENPDYQLHIVQGN